MRPELRAYILVVGRDKEGQPIRKVAKYEGAPLAGLNDNYDTMLITDLRAMDSNLRREAEKISLALADIEVEKYRRLEARFKNSDIERLMHHDG